MMTSTSIRGLQNLTGRCDLSAELEPRRRERHARRCSRRRSNRELTQTIKAKTTIAVTAETIMLIIER